MLRLPGLLLLLVCPGHHALLASLSLTTTGSSFDNNLLLAQVLQPTGLARGAALRFSYKYTNGDGALTDPDAPSFASPPPPLLLILADEAQLSTFYRRRGGENEADFFSVACLAPSALRLELDASQGGGELRLSYTDQFSLLLLQCTPSANTTSSLAEQADALPEIEISLLTLTINVETLTPDLTGQLTHHLGLENVLLPRAYSGLVLAAFLLWVAWLVNLYYTKEYATIIHIGCAFALGMKVLELVLEMSYYARLDADGIVPHFLRMGTSFQEHLSLLSQLVMLALLAYGYKLHRDTFSVRETRLFYLGLGTYIILAISQASCSSTSQDKQEQHQDLFISSSSSSSSFFSSQKQNKVCQAFDLGLYILQSLLLLLTIISVNWSISSLRSSLNTSPWSATSVPLTYHAFQQLHFLRGLFLLYLLLPTLLMVSRLMLLSWPYAWIDPILRQSLYLAIYVALAINFAPTDKTLYYAPFGSAAQWRMPVVNAGGGGGGGRGRGRGRGGGGGGGGAIIHPAERLRQRRAREVTTAAARVAGRGSIGRIA